MNHSTQSPLVRIAGALALAGCGCATGVVAPAPKAAPPVAQLRADHKAVVDRLTDQAKDYCRVSGQEAKVLQVGTTDLTRDPESRHIVYECVGADTKADEADGSEPASP